MVHRHKEVVRSNFEKSYPRGGGGISGMNWVYRCAAGPPHTHPINVYWNMERVTYKCINRHGG